jgi:hypothetical protein
MGCQPQRSDKQFAYVETGEMNKPLRGIQRRQEAVDGRIFLAVASDLMCYPRKICAVLQRIVYIEAQSL